MEEKRGYFINVLLAPILGAIPPNTLTGKNDAESIPAEAKRLDTLLETLDRTHAGGFMDGFRFAQPKLTVSTVAPHEQSSRFWNLRHTNTHICRST